MPFPAFPASVFGSLVWLSALTVLAFAVSYLGATRMRLSRDKYIGVLTAMTTVVTATYVAWLDVGFSQIITTRWVWGVAVAPLVAAFLIVGMTKLPSVHRLRGGDLTKALLWEGVVYGVAEGVLLSVLPVLMTVQLVHSLELEGTFEDLASWLLPVAASAVVIVVHHLGYWEYRNRLLIPITFGCGLLSVGYLLTASPIAPILGHILAHCSALLHGAELPPHPQLFDEGSPKESNSVSMGGESK